MDGMVGVHCLHSEGARWWARYLGDETSHNEGAQRHDLLKPVVVQPSLRKLKVTVVLDIRHRQSGLTTNSVGRRGFCKSESPIQFNFLETFF